MRIDLYTKVILTLIACVLLVIAGNALIKPSRSVTAAGALIGVQFSYAMGSLLAVDTRTGDIWVYGLGGEGGSGVEHLGRIDELGKPLIVTANR
jgi:hypothetical protein